MRFRLVAGTIAAVVAIDACQPSGTAGKTATEAGVLAASDRTALLALFDSIGTIIKAHNWDGWADQFTDDAWFMPPNHPAVHGRAAIRAWVDSFPPITDFSFTHPTVDGSGDFAWGTSGFEFTITPPGGSPVHDTLKQLIVFRRQADGKWKTAAVATSSDLPMPAPPPAPAAKK